ncbi:phospholipid carrier-dependent glycosyltransferase [Candidatus Leptofilum sp.]|uniref:phospholipid carrier-dependent glycosyltransferase n=1 Tax=Candidatus Leptofilum sp. TaxID=3241576 RepID=UPI003B597414
MKSRFDLRKGRWLETAVLLLFFALSIVNLTQLGPTFDEQGFITRGLGYLRGENSWMRVGHPLGLNALNASLLVADDAVQLPVDDPSWQLPNFHRPSELFLWEIGNDVTRVMFLARLPTVWLGLLLLALVYLWVQELTGKRWAALLALSLGAFDANLLAHGRLATTDFGLMTFAFLAGFLLWRFGKRPSWARAIWAGIGFGLLQNTKFTAGLFVPLFALVLLVILIRWWRESSPKPALFSRQSPLLVMLLVAYPLAAFLTLWAAYGFQIGTLPDSLPTLPQLSGLTLPLSHHLEQLLDIGGRLQKSTPAFLAGNYSDSGWWFYFPVAFLLKTPLPTLILLLGSGVCLLWLAWRGRLARRWLTLAALLIPPLGYFGFALTTDINLGYRHLLPILPFLFVFIAIVVAWLPNFGLRRWVLLGLVIWLGGTAVALHPHHLAFFNIFAGGPDGGWHYLVDSNLDWGQDLAGLQAWMVENEVEHVWLSYFGEGRPSYYSINFTGLDSFPPRLMNPQARPFYPHDPAPGIYAISATTLQGVHFANHDTFAWFRDKEPLDKIGYSIFIYEVLPHGEPAEVVLAGVQLDEIAPNDFARLQTNQVIPHWLRSQTVFLQPAASAFWLVATPDFEVSWVEADLVTQTDLYTMYRVHNSGIETAVAHQFSQDEYQISLLADSEIAVREDAIQLTTRWRNETGAVPLQIYVHLLDASGQIVAQWDGLDIAWEGWRTGDLLWQQHEIALPPQLPAGEYDLRVGLYDPAMGSRWVTPDGADFAHIATLELGQ